MFRARGKTKEGFLNVKQPSRFGKAWKRKWVVIRPNTTKGSDKTSVLLELYLEKGAYNKTVTSLLLEDVSIIRRVISKSQPKAFEFVKGSNVVLTLAGDSETDTQEWMEVFGKFLLPAAEQKELTEIPGYGTDVTRVSVVPNKDSERLKLTGNYLATVSRLAVTLHNITTGDKVLEWDLRHLKRFMLPSKGPQQDLEKIACLQISNRSPQGEGEYLLFSHGAKPLVESIYQRLSSAITVKERRSRTSSMLFEIPPGELEQFAKAINEGGDPGFVLVGADGSIEEESTEDADKEKETVKTNGDAGTNHVDEKEGKESPTPASTGESTAVNDSKEVNGLHSVGETQGETDEHKTNGEVVNNAVDATSLQKEQAEKVDEVSSEEVAVSAAEVSTDKQDVATEPIDKDESQNEVPVASNDQDGAESTNTSSDVSKVSNGELDQAPEDSSKADKTTEEHDVKAPEDKPEVIVIVSEPDKENDAASDVKEDLPADTDETNQESVKEHSNDNVEVESTDTEVAQKAGEEAGDTETRETESKTVEEVSSANVEPTAENDNSVENKEVSNDDSAVNTTEVKGTSQGEEQKEQGDTNLQESGDGLPSTGDSTTDTAVEQTEDESERQTAAENDATQDDAKESKESDDTAEQSSPVEEEEQKASPQETPHEAPQDTPQETPQEAPQDTPQETKQEAPQETPQEKPEETLAQGTSQETPEETPTQESPAQETPQETKEETPPETPQETPKESPQETPQETNEETPPETSQETSHEAKEETQQETPQETKDETPQEAPQPQGEAGEHQVTDQSAPLEEQTNAETNDSAL